MKLTRRKEGQRGFTLIEIIAVLVLLGILAAVAIPRFFDLQDEARKKNAEAGVATIQSALSMGYASHLLSPTKTDSATPAAAADQIEWSDGFTDETAAYPATWAGADITIEVDYDGQQAQGNWKTP